MAGTQIYVDSEEEILEVVERVRQATADDLTLIVPSRSRLARSRFNFQLLQKCADQTGKRVVVTSAEPAVEQMAVEAGLEVEGTALPASPGGIEEPQLMLPAEDRVFQVAGPASAPEPSPQTIPPPPFLGPTPLSSLQARMDEVDLGGWMRPAPPLRFNTPGRGLLYAGATIAILALLLIMILLVPAATVDLVVTATPYVQNADVRGQPGAGSPVPTRTVDLVKQANASFQATGVKVTPAAAATGTVVYHNNCPLTTMHIFDGQGLHAGGTAFVQQGGDISVDYQSSKGAPVRAVNPGASGNVDAGHVNSIDGNPYTGCLTVSNPNPTTGGTDEKKEPQVSRGDLDQAREKMTQDLTQQIRAELAKQARPDETMSDGLVVEPAQVTFDHGADDLSSTFSGSLQLKGEGIYYSPGAVRDALITNLRQRASVQYPARQLVPGRVSTDYKVTEARSGGHLTFSGSASGYLAPRLDFDQIRGQIAGKSRSQAEAYLATLPVRDHRIEQSGFSLPVLPLLGSRIQIRVTIDTGAASS